MQIERTKRTVKSSVSGLIFQAINLIMPFLIRTIIIKKLGIEYGGLNTLFTSILQVLSLSELGFASAIAYAMYKPIAKGDSALICALLRFIKQVYRIIGCIVMVIGIALLPFLQYFVKGDCPPDVNLYILYAIYLFNTVISYWLFAYKSVLLSAHQRLDVENIIMTICKISMYALQIIMLFIVPNYYVYVIFLPLSTIAMNILRSLMVRKLYPDYVCKGVIGKVERKLIFKNIGALVGHRLSNTVVSAVMNIIISAYLGLTLLSRYGNYYLIISALISIISVFYSSLMAGIGNSIVVDSVDKNYGDFKNITFVNVWIVGWMSISVLCLFQPFMTIWMGESELLPFSTVILFALYFYLWKFKDIVPTYKDAAGMWKADWLKPYVVTAVSLLLGLILIHVWGINGTIVAVIAGVFVISMPWETHVFFKRYFNRSPKNYYLRMLIYTVIIVAIAGLTYYVCGLVGGTDILSFILKLGVCVVLPNTIILLLSFKTPEFMWLTVKIKQIFKKN